MEAIRFVVFGLAKPAGSKRAFPGKRKDGSLFVNVSDDCETSRDWKNSVADAASQAFQGPLLSGPLRVKFDIYRPRLVGHYGTGKNAAVLKRSAPAYPTARPDVLKLARAIEDAITGIVWRDDAQIVDERLAKHWGEPARVEVSIEVLSEASS